MGNLGPHAREGSRTDGLHTGSAKGARRQRVIAPHMTDSKLTPTPNDCPLPRRRSDFATFADAIDYAALSEKGLNFHDMRGDLERAYPFAEMRADGIAMAYRLIDAGIERG